MESLWQFEAEEVPQEKVQDGDKSSRDTKLPEEDHCCEMRRVLLFREQASFIDPWALLHLKLFLLPAAEQEREKDHFPVR